TAESHEHYPFEPARCTCPDNDYRGYELRVSVILAGVLASGARITLRQGECTSGNVQLLWTRQLPPAARSREHSVSAASRVSAAMLMRCQIAALPMVVRTTSGSRPPRIAWYFFCSCAYRESALLSKRSPMSCTPQAALGAGEALGAAGAGFAASFVVPTHGVSLAMLTCQVRASGRFHSSAW